MDIDINEICRNGNKQDSDGIATDHEHGMVGFNDSGGEGGILHPAPIDKESDVTAVGTGEGDRTDETGDSDAFGCKFEIEHLSGILDAIKGGKDLATVGITTGLELTSAILEEFPADMWVSKCITCEKRCNVPFFSRFGFEELEAGRDIEKEVLNTHNGTFRSSYTMGRFSTPTFDTHTRTSLILAIERSQGKASD